MSYKAIAILALTAGLAACGGGSAHSSVAPSTSAVTTVVPQTVSGGPTMCETFQQQADAVNPAQLPTILVNYTATYNSAVDHYNAIMDEATSYGCGGVWIHLIRLVTVP
jgi:ABC-type glycerol-3-phosphate transport system substrate-binding protein